MLYSDPTTSGEGHAFVVWPSVGSIGAAYNATSSTTTILDRVRMHLAKKGNELDPEERVSRKEALRRM